MTVMMLILDSHVWAKLSISTLAKDLHEACLCDEPPKNSIAWEVAKYTTTCSSGTGEFFYF